MIYSVQFTRFYSTSTPPYMFIYIFWPVFTTYTTPPTPPPASYQAKHVIIIINHQHHNRISDLSTCHTFNYNYSTYIPDKKDYVIDQKKKATIRLIHSACFEPFVVCSKTINYNNSFNYWIYSYIHIYNRVCSAHDVMSHMKINTNWVDFKYNEYPIFIFPPNCYWTKFSLIILRTEVRNDVLLTVEHHRFKKKNRKSAFRICTSSVTLTLIEVKKHDWKGPWFSLYSLATVDTNLLNLHTSFPILSCI